MASTDAGADDTESYQVEFTDPSPPRSSFGNNTPLKRRSSSSTFSPPLLRCFSLNYAGSRLIQPAEILNRGTLVVPENQTRRSLFPPPVNGSTATAAQTLPPPHPLARTISDPTWLSCLQEKNPFQEPIQIRHVDFLGSDRGSNLLQKALRSRSARDTRAMKMVEIQSKEVRSPWKQIKEIHEWIDQMVDEDDSKINAPITPATNLISTDYKVLCDDIGRYNNGGSLVEETINRSSPEEVRSPEELVKKEITEEDLEAEADIVKAKRVGECTFLEFKCRCGSGYSVGIIGKSYFYKLV